MLRIVPPASLSRTARRPARSRLAIQSLEDRTVPAFTLAIDGDFATANVTPTTVLNTTTFTATASGATLDVADIKAELDAGKNVVIDTGIGGAEAGNINWLSTSILDNLAFAGAAPVSLTLQTSADATAGDITMTGIGMSLGKMVAVTINSSAPTAGTNNISLLAGTGIGGGGGNEASSIVLNSGIGDVTLQGTLNGDGNVTVSGDLLTVTGGAVLSNTGTATVNSPITLGSNFGFNAPNVTLAGPVTGAGFNLGVNAFNGAASIQAAVDGVGVLSVNAVTTATIAANIGSVTPLTQIDFNLGTATYGANAIKGTTINLNGGSLTGTGTVTAGVGGFNISGGAVLSAAAVIGDVVVNNGSLAPGGIGTAGTLAITGNLTFNNGSLDVDLGAIPDKVTATGTVALGVGNAFLFSSSNSHILANNTPVNIIDAAGTLTGEFLGIADNSSLLLDGDAVKVNYFPALGNVTLTQLAAAPGGTVTGADIDGTGYTVKLTGGGELVALGVDFVVRNTTTKSNITVKTKANASNDIAALGRFAVNGDLGKINASKADYSLTATKTVKSISAHNLNGMIIGGATTDKTTVSTAGDLFGNISTNGILSSLTIKGNTFGNLTADSVGKVKAGQMFFGTWNVPNGVSSITATSINSLNLTSKFLGTLAANGDAKAGIAGNISFTTINLTGDDGTAAKNGLKTLTAKGNVQFSQFDVKAGNVGSVKVGRFINSNLFLNYTLAGAFNLASPAGGAFDSATVYKLGSFTTTAKTIGDPANFFNTSFSNSQIVADTIGKVRLAGVNTDNGGTAFGLKVRTNDPKMDVRIMGDSSGPGAGAIAKNTKLVPSVAPGTPIADDLYFVDVV